MKVLKDGGYELAEVLLLFTNLQILDLDGNFIHFQYFSVFENFFDISTTGKTNIDLKIDIFVLSNVKMLSSF